ncbi:polysaccharide deacetylase family protein [Pacificispira sp.]|uniref:polysaccharide deacetylase family protein n=1 Tax=Pacificispira sp. TaxID=2888761 RepID=UPI003BAA0C0A
MTAARDGLIEELAAWRTEGRRPRLWWRDDDAVTRSPALDKLIGAAQGRPLALAVIPAALKPDLAGSLPDTVTVLPHGYAHRNHEPADRKKAEFGAARVPDEALRDIAAGVSVLSEQFGPAFFPLFVPPWNRIAPDLAGRLAETGLAGLSTYNDRAPGDPVPRLNTHVDILNWKQKRATGRAAFIGEDAAFDLLTDAFRRRRLRAEGTDPAEPVGLLTHHLDHDADSWTFLQALAEWDAFDWIDARSGLAAQ